MDALRRWWCGRRGQRKAYIMLDERGFIGTECPFLAFMLTALTSAVYTDGDPVEYCLECFVDCRLL